MTRGSRLLLRISTLLRGSGRTIMVLCLTEVLTLVGAFAFPAIQDDLATAWSLDNVDLGRINGAFYAGYAVAAVVFTSLTDRVDARRVVYFCALLTAVAACGFALVARDFWSALVLRSLAGIGLAGTFMPGLRALLDRLPASAANLALACYTASFAAGTALSFQVSGAVNRSGGWRAVFLLSSVTALAASVLAFARLRPVIPQRGSGASLLSSLRRISRRCPLLLAVLAYAGHMWELFALRSWMVTLLKAGQAPLTPEALKPTSVAAVGNLLAIATTFLASGLVRRLGRTTVALGVQGASMALSLALATWLGSLPYGIVACLMAGYVALAQGDSALLYGQTVDSAPSGDRGAVLALHSLAGFLAASAGSVAVGTVLDAGLTRQLSLGLAMATIGLGSAVAAGAAAVGARLSRHAHAH